MSIPDDPAAGWSAAHLLAEPTRRHVYDAVRAATEPMTRDDVARATGVNRRLVTFHLDRLAEAGLLAIDYARPAGRAGPGAGRPAKRYRPADVHIDVTLPPRRYGLAARILAAAVAEAPADAARRAAEVAEAEGEVIGRAHPTPAPTAPATLRAVAAALAELGYEPVIDGAVVRLRNCPFHDVVDVATELVCGINERLVCGMLAGMRGDPAVRATLGGAAGDCCVVVAAGPAGDPAAGGAAADAVAVSPPTAPRR